MHAARRMHAPAYVHIPCPLLVLCASGVRRNLASMRDFFYVRACKVSQGRPPDENELSHGVDTAQSKLEKALKDSLEAVGNGLQKVVERIGGEWKSCRSDVVAAVKQAGASPILLPRDVRMALASAARGLAPRDSAAASLPPACLRRMHVVRARARVACA